MKSESNKISGLEQLVMLLVICLLFIGCGERKEVAKAVYKYTDPVYGDLGLKPVGDTLHFTLDEHTSQRIDALNLFNDHSNVYMSFYDRGSKSLNIYDFYSGKLIKNVSLRTWIKSGKLDKASIFVKCFDSIYVTTLSSLYLLDSAGVVKGRLESPEDISRRPYVTSTSPVVFKDSLVYMCIKPSIDDKSLKAQREWSPLYEIDLKNKKKTPYYSLPEVYQNNLLGYSFVDYGYCVNNKGNFVFSFAADPNLYETNLTDYHVAYFGRSKFQKEDIEPVSKEQLRKEDGYKVYSLRDSYGEVLFDPHRKRYLRLAKQKMTEADFDSKKGRKKRSVMVFDENFKIIGETMLGEGISFSFLLFLNDGSIYTRTKYEDKKALHFVRLAYTDDNTQMPLTHMSNKE
ncbi:DUF4221 domain-containing protein [Chitinophaga filiformis]|uniref:DUF4221 family protein n=1 Tax=Chitinophaga filiformis TaxID=104663 RepID=UPI001F15B6A4|nr:DUF4221 family protein [Chitinophaga filiformis]MCF6402118.1 DUF4221 domain-containing protein [Chitinophaga filiformis]